MPPSLSMPKSGQRNYIAASRSFGLHCAQWAPRRLGCEPTWPLCRGVTLQRPHRRKLLYCPRRRNPINRPGRLRPATLALQKVDAKAKNTLQGDTGGNAEAADVQWTTFHRDCARPAYHAVGHDGCCSPVSSRIGGTVRQRGRFASLLRGLGQRRSSSTGECCRRAERSHQAMGQCPPHSRRCGEEVAERARSPILPNRIRNHRLTSVACCGVARIVKRDVRMDWQPALAGNRSSGSGRVILPLPHAARGSRKVGRSRAPAARGAANGCRRPAVRACRARSRQALHQQDQAPAPRLGRPNG